MKSKKSLCNNTLLKQDLHRFMPAMLLNTILLQLLITLPAFTSLYSYSRQSHIDLQDLAQIMINALNGLSFPGIAMIVGLIYSILLFSYLNKEKEAYNLHALPIRRETMFFSHYIAGLVFMTIPVAITMVLLFIMNAAFHVGLPTIMLVTFLETMIENVFFFSLGCIVMMLSGNNIICIIVYFILNACVPVFSLFSQEIRGIYIYGLNNNSYWKEEYVNILTPILYFTNHVTKYAYHDGEPVAANFSQLYDLENFIPVVLYLIPAIIFIFLAVVLYKKRHIEEVGELMVFPFAKSIFRIVFTIYASMLLVIIVETTSIEPIIKDLTYSQHFPIVLVLMILCGFVAYILSNMILSRSVHVLKKTSFLSCAILIACMVISMFIGKNTVFTFHNEKIDDACIYFYDWTDESDTDEDTAVFRDHPYRFNTDEIELLKDFITKIQTEGQNRPVSYFYNESCAGNVNIYLHYAGDTEGVNSYTLNFDLDEEQLRALKELLWEHSTIIQN